MTDNLRPMLYDARYEAHVVGAAGRRRTPSPPGRQALRVRRRARSRDADLRRPAPRRPRSRSPSPAPTATRWPTTTTAQPRPPVVFVGDGDARVVVRRETYEDLFAPRCLSAPSASACSATAPSAPRSPTLLPERADAHRARHRPAPRDHRRADAARAGDFDESSAGSRPDRRAAWAASSPRATTSCAAMAAGKHVVTANKQLLCRHGEELWAAAREHGVQLRFEAAVGRRRARSSACCRSRWPPRTSSASTASSTARRTSSSRGWPQTGADLRRGARRGPGARLRRGRPDRRRHRQGRRRQDGDPRAAGLRHAGRARRRSATRASSTSPPTTWTTPASSASALKLIGTAERVDGGPQRARAPGVPLRRAPAGLRQRPVQRRDDRVRRRSPRSRSAAPAPAARRPRAPCSATSISAMIPPASTPETHARRCRSSTTSSRRSTCTSRSPTSPACSPRSPRCSACRARVKSVVQKGLGEQRAARDGRSTRCSSRAVARRSS